MLRIRLLKELVVCVDVEMVLNSRMCLWDNA